MAAKRACRHLFILENRPTPDNLSQWVLLLSTSKGAVVVDVRPPWHDRQMAIQCVASSLERAGRLWGQLSELKVRRRDGEFAKETRTYPKKSDPRASRG